MFSPTNTVKSIKIPDVVFTVHRIGFGRRSDLDMKTIQHRQRLRELELDYPPQGEQEKQLNEALQIAYRKASLVSAEQYNAVIEKDVEPLQKELIAAIPLDVRKRRAALDIEYQAVDQLVRREWIRAGLVKIEGSDVDGMTADQLLEYGPPELADEIYEALSNDGQLTPPQIKNSPSPGTSGAVAGETNESINAPAAANEPAATT